MRKAVVPVAAAPALFAVASVLVAQQVTPQPVPATPAQPAVGTQPLKAANQVPYRAKQILGAHVSTKDNAAVGTVDDIVFDDTGAIEYLVVNYDNKLYSVPWEAAKFNFDKNTQTIAVPITQEQIKVIPTFTATTYPNWYAPEYRTQAYKWYGLTPGQVRRLERRGAIP